MITIGNEENMDDDWDELSEGAEYIAAMTILKSISYYDAD